MNHLTVSLLCILAFAALALAMDRHQLDLFDREFAPSVTRWLRVAGWGGLVLALVVVVRSQGWALGLVSYSGHTSLGAALVFGALIVHQQRKAARKPQRR